MVPVFFGRSAMSARFGGHGSKGLLACALLLEAGEQIEAVESNTCLSRSPVKAKRRLLALDTPAELPVGPNHEGGH
jgi:hypothetical protein